MADELPATGESLFDERHRNVQKKQEKYQAVVDPPEYRAELERLHRITSDFVATLRLCWIATTWAGDCVDKSLFARSIDDLTKSAILICTAVHEGAHSSARRELRYMIEFAIKALYVDQKLPKSPLGARPVPFSAACCAFQAGGGRRGRLVRCDHGTDAPTKS